MQVIIALDLVINYISFLKMYNCCDDVCLLRVSHYPVSHLETWTKSASRKSVNDVVVGSLLPSPLIERPN